MSEWVAYNGSNEQIAELKSAKNGYLLRYKEGNDSAILKIVHEYAEPNEITNYWIIPDDPLREMKIRQAQTGQLVWVRIPFPVCTVPLVHAMNGFDYPVETNDGFTIIMTNIPNWNIPNAEYSFTAFEG